MNTSVSIVIRSRNHGQTIRRALDSVRNQDHPAEIVLVDSMSTDDTVAIAREYTDQIVEIRPEDFTYGGALNTGAEAAHGDIHIALSAHAWFPDSEWVSRCVRHYDDPKVAGVSGERFGPDGQAFTTAIRQDGPPNGSENPYWGHSHTVGSWRASVRARFPFETDLIACEDKEWERRVRNAGFAVVIDPTLAFRSVHRRKNGFKAMYERSCLEGEAIQLITGKKPATVGDVVKQWLTLQQRSKLLQLASPYRAIDIFGHYVGERRGARK